MAFAQSFGARFLSTTAVRKAVKEVTVIGGGQMGAGIAQVSARIIYSNLVSTQ